MDYSKWDKLEVSDSEIESEDDRGNPDVTTFDGPQSVTFGGENQNEIKHQPSGYSRETPAVSSTSNAPVPKKAKTEEPTRNGGSTDSYDWSQNKTQVLVSVFAPDKCLAKHIRVKLDTKQSSEDITKEVQTLVVEYNNGADKKMLLDGQLRYPVTPDEEYDGSNVEWAMQDLAGDKHPRRVLVTFQKKQEQLPGTLWWPCAFKGHTEVDVNSFPDRKQNAKAQAAWAEAHKQFQDKIKNFQKTAI